MVILCTSCQKSPAQLRRSHLPPNRSAVCRSCFIGAFEWEVHQFILKENLFRPGEVIAIGVSGGKDSAVLLHLLYELNRRYDYGVHLVMIAVDEGIVGYRDHSLDAVDEQQRKYGLPLRVLSYQNLYSGWTMDRVVGTIGKRGNCTYCGVFRRQALERGAAMCSAAKLATGHNADDVAETILMNLLRGDLARLQRCVKPLGKGGPDENVPRVKPLFRCYEKEIVMYARFLGLTYFATECLYAPNAYRGHVRTLIKQFERVRPRSILDILVSGKQLAELAATVGGKTINAGAIAKKLSTSSGGGVGSKNLCVRCGAISSRDLCHACALLDQLEDFRLRPREILSLPDSVKRTTKEGSTDSVTAIEDLVSAGANRFTKNRSEGNGLEQNGGCACSSQN